MDIVWADKKQGPRCAVIGGMRVELTVGVQKIISIWSGDVQQKSQDSGHETSNKQNMKGAPTDRPTERRKSAQAFIF